MDRSELAINCSQVLRGACDNCLGRRDMEVENHPRARIVARDERDKSTVIEQMKQTLTDLQRFCPCCWVLITIPPRNPRAFHVITLRALGLCQNSAADFRRP